jgi:hypothetical protein
MSQSENKIPLPPGWAEDHLSEFLQASFKHILASFVHKKRKFNLLLKVDEVYRGLGGNLDNFEDPFAPTFLHRSHSSFIASCRLSMSGQVAETFPQLRTCLEYALYALHMNKNPSLSKVWVRRHMNKESRKESRQSFSHGNVMNTLLVCDATLHKNLSSLYERTIDYGGHPNERAVASSHQWRQEGDTKFIRNQLLHGDSAALDHALITSAQIGLGSLLVFELIFNERFDILNLRETIEYLKSVL